MRGKIFWPAMAGVSLIAAGAVGVVMLSTQYLPDQQQRQIETREENAFIGNETAKIPDAVAANPQEPMPTVPAKQGEVGAQQNQVASGQTSPSIQARTGDDGQPAADAKPSFDLDTIFDKETPPAPEPKVTTLENGLRVMDRIELEGDSPAAAPQRQTLKVYKGGQDSPDVTSLPQDKFAPTQGKGATADKKQGWNGFQFGTEYAKDPNSNDASQLTVVEPPRAEPGGEKYASLPDRPAIAVRDNPISTFSIDVDTGSYANMRRFLNGGHLPPADAVRIEELINYFDYAYPVPGDVEAPFSVTTHLFPTPWNPDTHLLRIGVKAYEVPREARPAANLVFLLDVSGSMNSPDKLPLLKSAFRILTRQLDFRDRVSIVVYAGAAGVVLEPTAGDADDRIISAIERLQAGGSTNGGQGIQLAYDMARQGFIADGINRVILATDGDMNVGIRRFEDLLTLIKRQRRDGIGLTTLGFGTGNYNDRLLEQLADAGNGNHAYIDNLLEANKVLGQQVTGTLLTVAKDVKTQIEFNHRRVDDYRIIGYANRMLRRQDFTDDRVDAGELGAGHAVTVLYEVTLAGSPGSKKDPMRYGEPRPMPVNYDLVEKQFADEFAFVKLRWKKPDGDTSTEISQPVTDKALIKGLDDPGKELNFVAGDGPSLETIADLRFAAAVAGFGQVLRAGQYTGRFGYDDVLKLARAGLGKDPHGHRHEFLRLVDLARNLDPGGRSMAQQGDR